MDRRCDMKIAVIILSCVCFCLLVIGSYLCLVIAGMQTTNTDLNTQVIQLQKDVTLRDDIISDMEKMAYPKSFENQRMLEKWLQTTSDKSQYEYYSEAAVELIKEARSEGYWMGVLPLNLDVNPSSEKIEATVPINGSGYVINLAIVAGCDLYIIDPFTGSVMKSMTMQSDFDLNDLKLR
jgi:hypothetical protein